MKTIHYTKHFISGTLRRMNLDTSLDYIGAECPVFVGKKGTDPITGGTWEIVRVSPKPFTRPVPE